jgi:predicted RNase H-related nuclease YkuK (DUF458 family)
MELAFKSLTNNQDIDLIKTIQNFLKNNNAVDIYVGCDSQNFKNSTSYAIAIVLYVKNKGGHILYSKETVPIIRDRYSRLWKEVERSIETAEFMRGHGIQRPLYIDLDLNPDPKYQSSQVLKAALGYVESMGYVPRSKPNAMIASHVADVLCK